jgi:hypothetical protein
MLARMADAKTWAKRVAAWRASGLSRDEFAARAGCTPASLKWWAWRLGRESTALVRVVRERPVKIIAASVPIVIEVRSARVIVAPGFDAASLRDVLAALRGADGQS